MTPALYGLNGQPSWFPVAFLGNMKRGRHKVGPGIALIPHSNQGNPVIP